MRNFQDTFETHQRSFISAFLTCMTVSLKIQSYKFENISLCFLIPKKCRAMFLFYSLLGFLARIPFYYETNLSELMNFYLPWTHHKTYGFMIISGRINVNSLKIVSSWKHILVSLSNSDLIVTYFKPMVFFYTPGFFCFHRDYK